MEEAKHITTTQGSDYSNPAGTRAKKNYSLRTGVIILICILLLSAGIFLPSVFVFENDWNNILQPPSSSHLLGTTPQGMDLLAGIIHGLSTSLLVALCAVVLSTLIGLPLALLASTNGNKGRAGIIHAIIFFIFVFLAWFYSFYVRRFSNEESSTQILISIFLFVAIALAGFFFSKKIFSFSKNILPIKLPVDTLISTVADIITSFPMLMIILTIAAISKPSIQLVVIVIGCTTWTGIFRVVRSTSMQILQQDFITAAKAMGISEARIIFKHLLPAVVPVLAVHLAFTFSAAIVLESSLTFLGAGLPVDTVTLGSLLADAKSNFNAWWLVVFPGTILFLLLLSLQLIASGLQKKFNPRLH